MDNNFCIYLIETPYTITYSYGVFYLFNYLISFNFFSLINDTAPITTIAIIDINTNNILLPVCGNIEFEVVLSSAFSVLIK